MVFGEDIKDSEDFWIIIELQFSVYGFVNIIRFYVKFCGRFGVEYIGMFCRRFQVLLLVQRFNYFFLYFRELNNFVMWCEFEYGRWQKKCCYMFLKK